MQVLQSAVERLVLETDASRAALLLAHNGDGFSIAAEAVREDLNQLRHGRFAATAFGDIAKGLSRDGKPSAQNNFKGEGPLAGITAQLLSPLWRGERLIGVVALQQAGKSRTWGTAEEGKIKTVTADIAAALEARRAKPLAVDFRAVATQAILDRLRVTIDAQRCTFRQPVQDAYAFPVTFESRAEGRRSLLGDFTIVQTGQPVIVKLLNERAQVVQNDCSIASTEPLFHVMLKHYGGMQAQIVTPFIVGDDLKGVLSVHELRGTRVWTEAEKAVAAEAATTIGKLFED